MRTERSTESLTAVSRRTFLRATVGSAAALTASIRCAHSVDSKSKPSDKVLIFGHVPERYLKEWEITRDFELVARRLGVQLKVVHREELTGTLDNLSDVERIRATALARQLSAEAQQGERPRPDDAEIEEAVRFFLAMRALSAKHKACAVTIACGDFRTKKLRVPCASLTLLQDHGIPAGCQVDIDAVLTMVLFKRVTGWVSFMGGPHAVEDQLRVSHCVLSRKMSGPAGRQPYYLAGYHRNDSGLTIHTDLRVGQPVTVARLTRNLERLLVAEGEVTESRDEPRWCRNMLVIRVRDVQRFMTAVRGGQYHMVVACGHHLSKMRELATEAGISVFAV